MRTLSFGPLITEKPLPLIELFDTDLRTAEYLALVGLRGRYAYCREPHGWYRHNTAEWVGTDTETVRCAVRRAANELFDRLAGDPRYSPGRWRLLDLNWVLGTQVDLVRMVVTVPAERLGLDVHHD